MKNPIDFEVVRKAAKVLKVLGHPQRLKIVELLDAKGHLLVGDLVCALCLPQAVVSKHLAILRAAGVVSSTVRGHFRHYKVSNPNAVRVLNCVRVHGGKRGKGQK